MSSGRIRKVIKNGWTSMIDGELKNLKVGTLSLASGQRHSIETCESEYGCVLIQGECSVQLEGGINDMLGPRRNPFEDEPYAIFATKGERITFTAKCETIIGIACSPAQNKTSNSIITPKQTGGGKRGLGNWEREVRFVCWSDNTEGNSLMAGETVTPSGNWSTIPPHRHQYDIPGSEVPYEEAYLFQFSKPQGFGLTWQFDDEGLMDQAFSVKSGDVLYMDNGYHPVVCGPGATLYHLTFMAGPRRMSKSRIHKDYAFLLDEQHKGNPYANQTVKLRRGKDE